MRTNLCLPLLVAGSLLAVVGCATQEDNRPIPGTLQSTDSKNSENNTPQTNPTPNPEPASNPPGPGSDYRPVPVSQ
jgi:hypothetical protein